MSFPIINGRTIDFSKAKVKPKKSPKTYPADTAKAVLKMIPLGSILFNILIVGKKLAKVVIRPTNEISFISNLFDNLDRGFLKIILIYDFYLEFILFFLNESFSINFCLLFIPVKTI